MVRVPLRVDMVGRRWEVEADTGTTQESSGRMGDGTKAPPDSVSLPRRPVMLPRL